MTSDQEFARRVRERMASTGEGYGTSRAGVGYCVAELAGREAVKGFSNNFGLRALERWAQAVTASGAKVYADLGARLAALVVEERAAASLLEAWLG